MTDLNQHAFAIGSTKVQNALMYGTVSLFVQVEKSFL